MSPRTKLIILGAGTFVFVMLFWLLNHSFLTIRVTSESSQEIQVTLGSSATEQPTVTTSKTIRRFVSRGQKQVMVRQGDESYFAVVQTKGFLINAKVDAHLEKEQARSFIGNKPGGCVYYISGVLLSSACGDSLSSMKIHAPATDTLPTFIKSSRSPFGGFVQGQFATPEGQLVVVESPGINEDEGAPYTVYNLDAEGEVSHGVALTNLTESETYIARPYKTGFVLYSASGRVVYYESTKTAGIDITLGKPNDKSLKLQDVLNSGEATLALYSSATQSQQVDVIDPLGEQAHAEVVEPKGSTKQSSEVVVQSSDKSKHFSFIGERVSICGIRACVQTNGKLEIYDLSDKKQKLVMTIQGVDQVANDQEYTYVVTKDGVLRIDLNKKIGYLLYSFNDYTYCGLKVVASNVLVCVQAKNGERSVVALGSEELSGEAIDKQVYKLAVSAGVKTVSAYGKYIYITPDVSSVEVVWDKIGTKYDPAAIAKINATIDQTIASLKIDTSQYKVINTLSGIR